MEVNEKITLDDLVFRFDPYNASIDFNPHKNMHQSIEEYFEDDRLKFIDYEECVKKGKVYVVRVYPHTAVGFYEVCASDCQAALQKMINALEAGE
jgi:hypothetical protein